MNTKLYEIFRAVVTKVLYIVGNMEFIKEKKHGPNRCMVLMLPKLCLSIPNHDVVVTTL